MKEVILDSFFDSLRVFVFILIFYIILSFVEAKLTKLLTKRQKLSPLIGGGLGLIPQCGITVVSADLYVKQRISLGTIIAIFIACSDEAIPILLSKPNMALVGFLIVAIKFLIGIIVGYAIDFLYKTNKEVVISDTLEEVHIGCCKHEIDSEFDLKKHLMHPLIHSFKIFIYIFIINSLFGLLIYFIGEDVLSTFFESNKYLTPIFATVVGLIPNCASSILLADMYMLGQLSFGTIVSGLIANTGLGLVVLLKNKNMIKKTIIIIGILLIVALASGYIINLIFGF